MTVPLSGEYRPPVPSRVIFGHDKISTLKTELDNLGCERVLVLSGRTVADKTNSVQMVQEAVGDKLVGIYSGLSQRAPLHSAVSATKMALEMKADALVGIGGSTISDASRMIAVMMAENIISEDNLRDLGIQNSGLLEPDLKDKKLPCQISIPTTLSAGEFNQGGGNVLDDKSARKIRVRHSSLYADLIVLDPLMTIGTPDWLWLSSGVKALDHCIERLYCNGNQPAIEATSAKAAELLFKHLPISREEDDDLEARLNCLVGAWLSMMGATTVGSGLSHAIGHVIGVKYDIGHGYTSCVTQPYVMEYNRPASADKQAVLARAAGVKTDGMDDTTVAEAVYQVVDDFILGLGMPHRLRELEIPMDDLREIAELTMEDGAGRNNPVPITSSEQVMEVLKKAW